MVEITDNWRKPLATVLWMQMRVYPKSSHARHGAIFRTRYGHHIAYTFQANTDTNLIWKWNSVTRFEIT